jgi:hypothetical protein
MKFFCMKPFLSFFVVLILFQSLFFGSLIKVELHKDVSFNLTESLIHKQVILDPFLVPDNALAYQNLIIKNEWIPFNFIHKNVYKNVSFISDNEVNPSYQEAKPNNSSIPVFLMNGILRL